MKHRMTVEYDAKLSFDLHLPADDERLIREQTPIRVVVEPADKRDDCSKFTLKIRVGDDDDAVDYEQGSFVHRSAAVGAATCLHQYLTSKPRLNVLPEVESPAPPGLDRPSHQSFVAIGWKMTKADGGHVIGKRTGHLSPAATETPR